MIPLMSRMIDTLYSSVRFFFDSPLFVTLLVLLIFFVSLLFLPMSNPLLRTLHEWTEGRKSTHVVHVKTGDVGGAGTDANVHIILRNGENQSHPIKLNNWLINDNERGQTSVFHVPDLHHVETVEEIELWRDAFGFGDSWFVEKIEIEVKRFGKRNCFPIHRWIKSHTHYKFREFDCSLPQNSNHKKQREEELEEKRKLYKYIVNVIDGPAQISVLPEDEKFTGEYMADLLIQKALLFFEKQYLAWTRSDWKTIEDVRKVYEEAWIALDRTPYSLNCWQEDHWFGLQRVQGCNAVLIRLCKEIPEKFGVTESLVSEFLEGLSLSQALKMNRLFIIDLEILNNLPCKDCRTICAPIALFFLNKKKDLVPIAIQLFQEKGENNPVFVPSDPHYTWLLAKMYYNNADAIFHQAYTHLGFTHLIMEGVAICTHRHLSPSHPLFRLLAPHFLFLLAINKRGLDKLVSVGGWVDRTMTCGQCGMFDLIKRGLKHWKLNVNGNIPKEIESRGVNDPSILPHYPYRDDAVLVYNAIKSYVTTVVKHFYDSNDDVINDNELQAWRRELVQKRKNFGEVNDDGGVGMLGVPGDDNGFTKIDQVIEAMTAIISVCSIGHAAANFQQFDEYAFPPNYPAFLTGEIPRDKRELTEVDIVSHLPDKEQTLDVMVITKLLSKKGTNSLGDFECQYLYHPGGIEAAEKFRAELEKISEIINKRNTNQTKPYTWLDPKIIPNAISI